MRRYTSVVLLWSVACAAGAAAADTVRPNVLVLLSDDHNYRALGCAGDPVLQTPALDRMAGAGVRFTHCFTPFPQCSPSRAALLTGQDSWTNGVRAGTMKFSARSPFWPELLSQAGYETFYTGKWHNVGLPWDRGFTSGANIHVGGESDHAHMSLIGFGQSRDDKQHVQGFSSDLFAAAAIEFIRGRKPADKPFCAYVSFTAPHDPWMPPGSYATQYSAASMPVPLNFMPRPPFAVPDGFENLRDQSQLPFPRTEADVREAMTQYYGMLTHLDAQVGRILDVLDQQGLSENTLVIFAGDHGYSLGSHGFVGKQCMYEEGIRLPLIVRFPRATRAEPTCAALVTLMDFFPTICEAAGVPVPHSVEGKSLLQLYRGTGQALRSEVYSSHHSPEKHLMSTRCIRTERYKLIQHLVTDELEFFDLIADPWELRNLAGQPQVAEVQAEHLKRLTAWRSTDPEK